MLLCAVIAPTAMTKSKSKADLKSDKKGANRGDG
jgi:hypothetical protein